MKAFRAIVSSFLLILKMYVTAFAVSLIERQPGLSLRTFTIAVFVVLLLELFSERNTNLEDYLFERNLLNRGIVSLGFLLICLLINYFVF